MKHCFICDRRRIDPHADDCIIGHFAKWHKGGQCSEPDEPSSSTDSPES